jgi:hypothetical protein
MQLKAAQQLKKVAPVTAETAAPATETAAPAAETVLQQLKNKTIFKFQYLNSKFKKN